MAGEFLRVGRLNAIAQLKKTGETLLNAAFPRFCVRCRLEGSLLCAECDADWQPNMPEWKRFHMASFFYGDPVARQLIGAWKYAFDETAWEILKRKVFLQNDALEQVIRSAGIEVIVPVSLHAQRARERGFDQSNLIADAFAERFCLPKSILLKRMRGTGKQAERGAEERVDAMRANPFIVITPPPGNVLLVDDVWTTGATARAARRALKEAGAKGVWVYTIAKG